MDRRPESENIDVDPPREPIRPDAGYRVGARIIARDGGGTRLAAILALGIVLTGIAFAALGPRPTVNDLPVGPNPSRSIATALPDIAILQPPAPTRRLPVYAGGLRWLDPAGGSMSGDPYTAPGRGLFVDADGHGLCVCLEVPWSQDELVNRVTIRRYSNSGEAISQVAIRELHSVARVFGDPISVQAAIEPNGRRLWIVHVVRDADAWTIGLDEVDLATLTVTASMDLDPIPVPTPGGDVLGPTPAGWFMEAASAVWAALRVSPDGSKLAVILSVSSDPGIDPRLPKYQEARLSVPSNLDPAIRPTVEVAAHDATTGECFSDLSAWATNRDFVTICGRPVGNQTQAYVRIAGADDALQLVDLGLPDDFNDTEWLLDADRGVIDLWTRAGHTLSRLDVATRSVTTAAVDPLRAGVGDLTAWPVSARPSQPWAPLTGPDLGARPPAIVGSADGRLIYALGQQRVVAGSSADVIASTGIWVFDAEQATLVAHWRPEALYSQIGFAPGSGQLVTVAYPGADGDGQRTDWATSLRFHDPRSGAVTELLGNVEESSGFAPILIVPNVSGAIAGS
jgi:hypothetical protein